MTQNPLLQTFTLPEFSKIRPAHVEPAIDQVLAESRVAVTSLLENQKEYTWENLVVPLEKISERINRIWSPVSHMNSVVNTEELREAYNKCLPKLSAYSTEMGQNSKLYHAYRQIQKSSAYSHYNTAQKQIIENAIRDFHLAGVDLPEDKKKRFKEIMEALSNLSSEFDQHLLDATHAWYKHISDEEQLSGFPDSIKSLAAQAAKEKNLEGWVLTLDFPLYYPTMLYADNRELREEMYTAYVTRASDQGPNARQFDNSDIMQQIMALRHESALLLGFNNYAERSLATKMAKNTDQVLEFLHNLVDKSRVVGEKDLAEVKHFAKQQENQETLEAWDIPYYSEKLRQHTYAISQEELKPYFPENKVLNGLFKVVERLYNISVRQQPQMDAWHPDVKYFEIVDGNGKIRAAFFLDLYARAKKRGGAWMDECLVRMNLEEKSQYPVAYLVCNFSPPVGDKPALFTHDEVITLFHEFGHGLHHMLTKIDYPSVAGINGVPWDAVELPSQFMENWCWERSALDVIAEHFKTGEKLPDALYEKMIAAKNFQSGMQMLRQLEFAIFDFRIHKEYDPEKGARIYEILNQVRDQVSVVKPPKFNRFAHGFSHIFAGGYAAGYYSYKWAEVLSADAFSRFEEEGVFDEAAGRSFLENILEKGGSEDPMKLFVAFRGREPEIDALLRHNGIAA